MAGVHLFCRSDWRPRYEGSMRSPCCAWSCHPRTRARIFGSEVDWPSRALSALPHPADQNDTQQVLCIRQHWKTWVYLYLIYLPGPSIVCGLGCAGIHQEPSPRVMCGLCASASRDGQVCRGCVPLPSHSHNPSHVAESSPRSLHGDASYASLRGRYLYLAVL